MRSESLCKFGVCTVYPGVEKVLLSLFLKEMEMEIMIDTN